MIARRRAAAIGALSFHSEWFMREAVLANDFSSSLLHGEPWAASICGTNGRGDRGDDASNLADTGSLIAERRPSRRRAGFAISHAFAARSAAVELPQHGSI
jgi:hypothetical protein